MDKPDLRDREGNPVEVVSVKSVKLKRGGREELERLPWYSNGRGEWFVELKRIADWVKR